MKNRLLTKTTLGLITFIAIACNPKKEDAAPATTEVDKEQIKTELQALENSFAEVLNSRNASNFDYYADDAVSFSQNEPTLYGKKAIDSALQKDLEIIEKGRKVTFTTNEVFPSADGNQVVEIGSYVVVDSTNTKRNSGNYIGLFEKRDGKYHCIRDMSVSDMPREK